MKIAIIGAGVSGLCAARGLASRHDVTVFESDEWVGGHAHTVAIETRDGAIDVDTGFIVFNRQNYPLFSNLLGDLGVATRPTEMSFSVSSGAGDYEFRGDGLGPWVQLSNLPDRAHTKMLWEILRFNRAARALARDGVDAGTLGEFLEQRRFSPWLKERFLVPLGSAIWSADPASFDELPMLTFSRFMDNHGMLALKGRPQWSTIVGGSRRYVDALTKPFAGRIRRSCAVDKVVRDERSVTVLSRAGLEVFDAAVLAVHSDDALRLLGDPTPHEAAILGDIGYQSSVATLHHDARVMPRRRRAWAAWNSHIPSNPVPGPTVTYWMNRLQHLPGHTPILVSLNRESDIDPDRILGQWEYAHPVYHQAAIVAQRRLHEIQGQRRTWYCGAYFGYGFHEDGVRSARDVCVQLGSPW